MGLRNISNRMAGLLSSIFPIGETVCYFPTRVSKIIVSFMHFWKNTILRSNIKRFPKGLGMRQMNQRNSLCWWQESVFKLKTGMLNQFKARHQGHIVIRYENVEKMLADKALQQ